MLVKKEETFKKQNSSKCTVFEYEYPKQSSSFATALINGRYPEEGKSVNLDCEQIYFVISGSGVIHSEKGDFYINEGDLYYFEKKEAYFVNGNNLLVAIMNFPKWDFNQYKII
ncbi:MAG: hypothetical protein PHY30_00705 [Candidatus Pacebacteria bacterium]|nr:hypothetical protein [Candidatus Paceibacterota bacterium]